MPTRPPGTPTVDVTADGQFGVVGNAVFMTGQSEAAGSGQQFSSFVGIQHGNNESGYNSDHSPQFDEKPHSHSILLAEVPIVIGDGTNGTEEGVAYREFLFNLNEPNGQNKPYLSLDELQIWQEESGNLNNFTPGAGFAGSHTNYLAYDLDATGDNWVGLIDGISHGSGQGEYRILIRDDAFINDAAHRYVTVYSQLGLQSGWDSDGGFEEWGLHGASGQSKSAIAVTKTATVPGGTANVAGEVITYNIRLDNVGNVNQTGVTVTDPSVTDLTRNTDIVGNNDNVLNVGEVWSYTAHHTVTQAELDSNGNGSGVIFNTVTADTAQVTPVTDTTTVQIEQTPPSLEMTKTADVSSVDGAGDVINYTITVTNVGTTTLDNPVVSDPQFTETTPIVNFDTPVQGAELLAQVLNGDYNAGDTNQNGVEDPGETFQYVNAGDTNQNGIHDPGETFVFTNIGDTNQNGFEDTGETFQYYNAGDTNQNGVEDPGETFQFNVSHDLDGVDANHDGFNDGDTNMDGRLNVGETWQYTVSYTVTQDDIDNGGVVDAGLTHDNTATVTTDQGATDQVDTSVTIVQNPHVTLVKDATVDGGTADSAGEVIAYTIAVTNDGNMSLTDPVVSDPTVSGLAAVESGGFNVGDTDQDGRLSVGETWQYTANHTVTQAELDAGGTIDNTASVTTGQGATDDDDASVTVEQNPHVTLVKDATVDGGTANVAGEVIAYTIAVANDGNVSLTNPLVSDPFVSSLAAVESGGFNVGDTNSDGVLSVGETWQYTANHTVTQAELDAGGTIDNTATISTDQGATDDDDASITVEQSPHVTLVKDATVDGGTADAAGEVIAYTISVANDGNVSLTNPVVSDASVSDLAAVESGGFNVGDANSDGVLSVGETWQYTASHTVTQAELDAGGTIDNTAAVSTDQGATDDDDASITIEQHVAMELVKTALGYHDLNNNNVADAGDTIDYSFLVENDGNVTLHNISVTDPLVSMSGSTIASLTPGGSDGNYTATYTILQDDVDNGFFDNEATAQADETTVSSGVVHTMLTGLPLLV